MKPCDRCGATNDREHVPALHVDKRLGVCSRCLCKGHTAFECPNEKGPRASAPRPHSLV